MKHIYICGDSFAVADPEYGASWPELLADLLIDQAQVVNLSSVAASNLLINIQANLAVQLADYIIVMGTAVTRAEVAVQPVDAKLTLLERFQRNDLVAYSILRPYRSHLNTQQQQLVRQYHTEFFDLDLAIHRDHAIISNTLDIIERSGRPYLFDQGGFEHPRFGGTQEYFAQARRSQINLWDLGTTQDERPYYHVKEPAAHERIARYYYTEITKHL
jgi:hypothetical protein